MGLRGTMAGCPTPTTSAPSRTRGSPATTAPRDPALERGAGRLAAGDRGSYADVLAALQQARLLVPVVAVLGEVEYDDAGLAHDKTSDMATVLLQGADGRLALLAFTGTATLTRLGPEARPVPVAAALAARSALQDGAAALVVDLAGPVRFVVEGEDLRGLADGLDAGPRRRRHRLDSARPGNRRLASCVDRSVPPYAATGADPQAEARTIASHPHRPPCCHRSSGPVPKAPACGMYDVRTVTSSSVALPTRGGRRDWLPLADSGSLLLFRTTFSGVPKQRTSGRHCHQEDTSAPSCVSTTGSGFPRSDSLDPTGRRSASCRPTRP